TPKSRRMPSMRAATEANPGSGWVFGRLYMVTIMCYGGRVGNVRRPMRYHLPSHSLNKGGIVTVEEFLAQLSARDIPKHPMGRIRLLARELAEGAYDGCWPLEIYAFRGEVGEGGVTQ